MIYTVYISTGAAQAAGMEEIVARYPDLAHDLNATAAKFKT